MNNKDIVINPYNYTKFLELETTTNKINSIDNYLDNLKLSKKIIILLKNIKETLNKYIVYEFGYIDSKYILKLYLHGKDINNIFNDIDINQKEFYTNILKIINILNNYYNLFIDVDTLSKYLHKIITRDKYNVYAISFYINLYESIFNNSIYFHSDYYNEGYHIELKKVVPIEFDLLMELNINTYDISYNNINKILYNLKQVKTSYKFLTNDCNVDTLINNLDKVINNNFIKDNNIDMNILKMDELLNYNWYIIFEYIIDKEYLNIINKINKIDNIDNIVISNNNILIIKIINTSYDELIKFLNQYNFNNTIIELINNDELFKYLKYDLFIHINITKCEIIGISFLNYF
jgi:hypothetical protein